MRQTQEGGDTPTPKIKIPMYGNIRSYLKNNFGDLPEFRRSILLNEIEAMCESWFVAGGGDAAEFETRFNNQQNTRS